MKAVKILSLIEEALSLIEEAIKEDPQHLGWYREARDDLLRADSEISFCVND